MGILKFIREIPFGANLVSRIKQSLAAKTSFIKGTNNWILNNGVFNNIHIDIQGNNNEIKIGNNTIIKDTLIYIRGNYHSVIIEENCYFGGGEIWIEDDHCSLIIQPNTTIEEAHLAVTESFSKLEIRRDCMLAKHVEIRTGDSHSIIDNTTGERINKAANVTIKEHVWIGAHVKILKGVNIGNNSVIGTASVVTSDVPSNCIAAGAPAKVVKTNIDWKRERMPDL